MTEQKENFRDAKGFRNRVLRRQFEGMELYVGGDNEGSRLIYDCYESDGTDNYSVSDYLGSVIFDIDREGAYQHEDAAAENLTRLQDDEPSLNVTRSSKG